MKAFSSEFGEKTSLDHPLPEHPNPLFQRDSFVSLNGPWDFTVTKSAKKPDDYPQQIVVPFAPETSLSGLGISIHRNDYLHYRKKFDVPDVCVGHGRGGYSFDLQNGFDKQVNIFFDGHA